MGHHLLRSTAVLSISVVVSVAMLVLCTETGNLLLLSMYLVSFVVDNERGEVLKLGSFRALASLLTKLTKKQKGGKDTLYCSL